MGTLSALKMVLTDSATSAPIPSPGIRVTVYFPPYLVGLKISYIAVARSEDNFMLLLQKDKASFEIYVQIEQ
jgi:hypothetical protein